MVALIPLAVSTFARLRRNMFGDRLPMFGRIVSISKPSERVLWRSAEEATFDGIVSGMVSIALLPRLASHRHLFGWPLACLKSAQFPRPRLRLVLFQAVMNLFDLLTGLRSSQPIIRRA